MDDNKLKSEVPFSGKVVFLFIIIIVGFFYSKPILKEYNKYKDCKNSTEECYCINTDLEGIYCEYIISSEEAKNCKHSSSLGITNCEYLTSSGEVVKYPQIDISPLYYYKMTFIIIIIIFIGILVGSLVVIKEFIQRKK